MNQIVTYVRDSVEELRHVRWPTRQQAVRLSVIVLIFTLVSALAFGLVDAGLQYVVRMLLSTILF